MNLAFLGSYARGNIKTSNYLINWPDGLFSIIIENKFCRKPRVPILASESEFNKSRNSNERYLVR